MFSKAKKKNLGYTYIFIQIIIIYFYINTYIKKSPRHFRNFDFGNDFDFQNYVGT